MRYKITLHSELGRDDLHMALLDLHERLKLYGECVEMEPEEAEGLISLRSYPECPNKSCYYGNDGKGFTLERTDDNEYRCPNCGNTIGEKLLIQFGWSRDVLHRKAKGAEG